MAYPDPAELFPTDEPVEPGHLIGRSTDVADIAGQLRLGSNLILSAPRRTGKTSVCDAVIAQLRDDPDCYAIAVDLFGLDTPGQLADALIEATMSARPALRRAVHTAKQAGRTIYESVSVTFGGRLIGTGDLEGIEIGVLPTLRTDPHKHLAYALQLPERIAAADGKRLILFVDEFQAVETIGLSAGPGGAAALKQQMRSTWQRSRHVSFLFAGSLEHMMRALFGDRSEAFFNWGGFHPLQPITRAEWREGIGSRLHRANIGLSIVALDAITDAGGGHPRSTMLIARHAYQIAAFAGDEAITSDTTTLAYEAAMLSERPKHEQTVERIQHVSTNAVNRIALRTITAIAAGGKPYAGARNPSEPTRALHALRDAGLIERVESGWRITDPLLAEYLRRLRGGSRVGGRGAS